MKANCPYCTKEIKPNEIMCPSCTTAYGEETLGRHRMWEAFMGNSNQREDGVKNSNAKTHFHSIL
jgi:hypothetical protein